MSADDPYIGEVLTRLIEDLDDAIAAHHEGDGPGLIWRIVGVKLQLRWLLEGVTELAQE